MVTSKCDRLSWLLHPSEQHFVADFLQVEQHTLKQGVFRSLNLLSSRLLENAAVAKLVGTLLVVVSRICRFMVGFRVGCHPNP